jgi:hypothetical protein
MNFKIVFTCLLATTLLTSCLDCMDCQSTTDINLSVEYYSSNNGLITLDSTNSFSYSGPGYVNGSLSNEISLDMSSFLSPVSVRETCGEELKTINNSTVNFETTVGDSSALFKYNWSESWDCK